MWSLPCSGSTIGFGFSVSALKRSIVRRSAPSWRMTSSTSLIIISSSIPLEPLCGLTIEEVPPAHSGMSASSLRISFFVHLRWSVNRRVFHVAQSNHAARLASGTGPERVAGGGTA